MGGRTDAAFDAFVEREHEALLRLARLLEEDPLDAEALVRTALARVRRSWRRAGRRGNPATAARTAVVRQVLGRRSSSGPRTSGWVDEFEAAWAADDSAELRSALAELPVRTRTATVLATWAGLPEAEVAVLLRDRPEAVRDEVAAGTARLSSALAPARLAGHAGPPGVGAVSREDLARRLDALADDAVPPGTAASLAGTAPRDARRVRRRWAAGAVATCAAVAVAVPVLAGSPPPAERAAAEEPPPRRAPSPVVDVTQLPPRGSLADDEAFLAAVRALPWAVGEEWGVPEEHLPRPEDRRVLFAGDVPGGRWALVAGSSAPAGPSAPDAPGDSPGFGEETVLLWLTGPPGARPEDMRVSSYPYGVAPGMTPSLVDPRTGTMVVLTAPGDEVEVSARPEIAADGSRSRTWERIESEDGVAVVQLPVTGLPWLWSASYRLVGAGPTAMGGVPDVAHSGVEHPEMPRVDVGYPHGRPSAAHREVAENAAGMVLTQLGLSPDDTVITALVTADMPAPASGRLALVAVRVPSGAVVLVASWSQSVTDGEGTIATTGECGLDVRAAGAPVGERVVAAACEVWDPATGGSEGSVLVVSTPPSVAAVRTYTGDGDYLGELALTDGRLVVPLTGIGAVAEVEAVTTDGVLLGRSELLSTDTWLGE